MKKMHVILFLVILTLASFVTAGDITRSFSSSSIKMNEILDVRLTVTLSPDESFYVIEEHVPSGWIITNPGGGVVANQRVITWVVFQNPVSTTYTYTVQAPPTVGFYDFRGNYTINNSLVRVTGGSSTVETQFQITTTATSGGSSGGGGGGGGSSSVYPQCIDKKDNDQDGLIDYPNDPGCLTSQDNSEELIEICNEKWVCDEWGVCEGGVQVRECTDMNDCGTTRDQLPLEQECEGGRLLISSLEWTKDENVRRNMPYFALVLFVLLAFIIIEEILRRRRRKLIRIKHKDIYEFIKKAESNIKDEKAAGDYYNQARDLFSNHKNHCSEKEKAFIQRELLDLYNRIRRKKESFLEE